MSHKVGVGVMCFGALRRLETLKIEMKDVTIGDLTTIAHPYLTKRRKKGFMFKLPEWLAPTFVKHTGQFKEGLTEDCRFMRNCNSQSMTRTQNMGEGHVSKFSGTLAQRLKKDNLEKFTAKSFRRSAATQLLETGISIVGSF